MSPDEVKAAYRDALGEFETVAIRRYSGVGTARTAVDTNCRGRVIGYAPQDLVGNLQQGDRKLIIFSDDLVANGLSLPVTTNDKAYVRGKELAIIAVDDSTRRVAGVLIAYELSVRG